MTIQLMMQVLMNGVILSFIYILFALGITLIFGVMHMVNFSHGVFYTIGAFVAYLFVTRIQINYFFTFILSMLILGGIGMVTERILLRPVQRQFMPSIVLTLGLLIFLEGILLAIFGARDKVVPFPFSGGMEFFGMLIRYERLAIVVVSVALIIFFHLFIQKTKVGQAMRAIQDDKEAAALQGISVDNICSLAWLIGAGLAGVAGMLVAPLFLVNPAMGHMLLLKAFVIIVIGGMGSILGAVVGGFVLGIMESFISVFIGAQIAHISGFIVLVLVLIFRPRGLMGRI